MRRTVLGLFVACCSFAAVSIASPETALAKRPSISDRVLTSQHQAQSRPTQIPKTRRIKAPEKSRVAVATYRIVRRKLVDVIGSLYARCGSQIDLSAVDDDPDDDSMEELEIESVSFELGYYDERKYHVALEPLARVSYEELVYPSERCALPISADWAMRASDRPSEASLRMRLLPKTPSSDDDGASIA